MEIAKHCLKPIVGLLTICLLRAVFFADFASAYIRNYNIGRVNVSKYVEEHLYDDPFAVQNNANCAKVTYPSLSTMFYHAEAEFKSGSFLYGREHAYERFFSFITVNHHGIPNQVALAGPRSGFSTMQGNGDTQMYVCVSKEHVQGASKMDIEPHVSVDWLTIFNFLATRVVTLSIGTRSIAKGTIYSSTVRHNSGVITTPIVTVLLNGSPIQLSEFSNGAFFWIDSYDFYGFKQSVFHDFVVGAYIQYGSLNEVDALISRIQIDLIFVFEKYPVVFGVPPTSDSFLTENGNNRLEADSADWSLLCMDYPFKNKYSSTPYVFITVSFREKYRLDLLEQPIFGWVEFINEVGFRACLSRSDYVGLVSPGQSVPFVEYLVISQDGIYDEARHNDLLTTFSITLELEFSIPYHLESVLNFVDTCTDCIGIGGILAALAPGKRSFDFRSHGYIAKPECSSKLYAFFSCYSIDNDDTATVQASLTDAFSSGYFPYASDVSDTTALQFLNILYPFGEPQDASQKIKTQIWFDWPCLVEPFSIGQCSLPECNGVDTNGVKTITRSKIERVFVSPHCPPLTAEIPCNLPPCVVNSHTFSKASKSNAEDGGRLEFGSYDVNMDE